MKKIIIIIIIVLALGAGGFLGFKSLFSEKPAVPFVHDPGDYFVTDIKDSHSLLKSDMMIQAGDIKKQKEIEHGNHRIRNAIIFILRSKTEEELKATGIETALNREIIDKLNAEFETEVFIKVYFNEFVIQ